MGRGNSDIIYSGTARTGNNKLLQEGNEQQRIHRAIENKI